MNSQRQHLQSVQAHLGQIVSTRKSIARETVFLGGAIFLLAFAFYYLTVGNALFEGREKIRDKLKQYAELSASVIDGEQHETFVSPKQQTTASYRKALMPLKRILDNNPEIAYIYTLVLRGNKIYFILDPTPEDKKAETGIPAKSNIMDEYKNPTAAMMEAFKNQKTTVDLKPYDDEWGHFISSFSPIYDSYGKFLGVIGVDMNAQQYEHLLKPDSVLQTKLIVESLLVAFAFTGLLIVLRYVTFAFCKWINRVFLQ
jgi:hypothetical protein